MPAPDAGLGVDAGPKRAYDEWAVLGIGRRGVEERSSLRRGDVVALRSAREILATLDGAASLEGVPFMPEMLGYFGRRFTVTARVERACDTITGSGPLRMQDTVLLDDLRCDGGPTRAARRAAGSTGRRRGCAPSRPARRT